MSTASEPPVVLEPSAELGPMLVLREAAVTFFARLDASRSSSIIIDFSGTRFMSRSFAHEYLVRRSASRKHIQERNEPEEVRRMIALVERQVRDARSHSSPPQPRLAMNVAPVSTL